MNNTTIYQDALLRASVVVEAGGELWFVPRRPGGWASRQRLTMTPEAQAERLRPARGISPAWLGIQARERGRGLPQDDREGAAMTYDTPRGPTPQNAS